MNSESRNLRSTQAALASAVALATEDAPPGLDPFPVITVAVPGGGTYPTSAQVAFPCKRQWVGGTESAGSAVSLTTIGGVFYVLNLGTAAPPEGTIGIMTEIVDGRRVMRYSG